MRFIILLLVLFSCPASAEVTRGGGRQKEVIVGGSGIPSNNIKIRRGDDQLEFTLGNDTTPDGTSSVSSFFSINGSGNIVTPGTITASSYVGSLPTDSVTTNEIVDGQVSLVDLATAVAQALIPVGTVLPYAGSAPPSGYLLANGNCVSESLYSALHSLIGSTYGTGCAAGSFRLPDLRGRAPVGLDNLGGAGIGRITAAWADSLGGAGGSETTPVSGAVAGNTADFNSSVSVTIPDGSFSKNLFDHDHTLASNSYARIVMSGGGSYIRGDFIDTADWTTDTGAAITASAASVTESVGAQVIGATTIKGFTGSVTVVNPNTSIPASTLDGAQADHTHAFSGNASSTIQPSIALSYIIKY